MLQIAGPVYEVTHHIEPQFAADYDTWLARHTEEMLALPGVRSARSYSAGDDTLGRQQRVTLYFFASDDNLDQYLDGPAKHMRAPVEAAFVDHFEVSRRILHEAEVVASGLLTVDTCLNCGTPLSGQYCGHCGQRARSRLISVWELTREAFGDLLELDSRFWRTLIPLAIRPGQLTLDYLRGRRSRFMPPFRTYLVLSIVFFLVAFFDPRQQLGILFEPEPEVPAEAPPGEQGPAIPQPGEIADTATASDNVKDEDLGGFNVTIAGDEVTDEGDCQDIEVGDMPEWMARRLTPERLQVVCKRMVADGGKAFLGELADNVPAALIILLPVMALVLKILYPLSRRYYVEHLLFVVHFHAFVFLILTVQILFSRLATLLGLPEALSIMTVVAVSSYIPVYLYKALQRVYAQGHLLISGKFLVLSFAYFFGLLTMLGVTALFSALSL